MFNLKSPCVDCPFRRGLSERFKFGEARFEEIITATAFQCHRTVDYSEADLGERGKQGDNPQQCAGLMAVLARSGRYNAIMRAAMLWGYLDPKQLDPRNEAYSGIVEAHAAHCGGK